MTVKATYLGHATVLLEGSKKILIDPFLTSNPKAAAKPKELTGIDVVAVTHDHEDHFEDAFSICKREKAVFVGIHELAVAAQREGLTAEPMNIGGSVTVGGVRISMVHATHSSYKGHVAGLIFEIDGKTIYHMGDTGLTYDMKILPEFFDIDLAFVPIGDRYTMGPPSAAKAVEWCGAKKAVPIHYNTFPLIEVDPEDFRKRLPDGVVCVVEPGGSVKV